MSDLYGFTGKILVVDLTTGEFSTLDTTDYLDEWVGGRGIGAKLHWDLVGPEVKAFDPENVLTFILGSGTGIIDTRTVIQAVSPLGYPVEHYYRSTMGSHFGSELKHAGWDGLVVKGAADKLSYILIENGEVSIRDGQELTLMDTYATQQHLWARHSPDHKVALIGPAGENLCADAHIQAGDHNAAGIGGFGAVMGSKKLKAICVRGTLDAPPVKDVEKLLELRHVEASIHEPFPGVGAAAGSMIELAGQTGEARTGYAGCFGCQQPCGYAVRWNDGSVVPMGHVKCGEFISCSAELAQTGEYVGKNHWKRITQQGLLGITGQPSYRMVVQNDIDNDYDEPITLLHNGVITEADLGIDATYGTPEFTDAFNRMLAYDKGNPFAAGAGKYANETLGTKEAIEDFEWNSLRKGIHGFAPGFWIHLYRAPGLINRITSTVSAADQRSMYHYLMPMYEWFVEDATAVGEDCANWGFTYAAKATKNMQDYKTSMDIVDRCFFNLGNDSMGAHMHLFQQIHEAITGQAYGPEEERTYAERVWVLERSIQMRQGHTRADDDLYDSVYTKMERFGVTREKVTAALEEYYDMRNIDHETGFPRRSEYERLGLADVADRLESEYGIKLPA